MEWETFLADAVVETHDRLSHFGVRVHGAGELAALPARARDLARRLFGGRELDDARLAAYLPELFDAGRAASGASMAVAAARPRSGRSRLARNRPPGRSLTRPSTISAAPRSPTAPVRRGTDPGD